MFLGLEPWTSDVQTLSCLPVPGIVLSRQICLCSKMLFSLHLQSSLYWLTRSSEQPAFMSYCSRSPSSPSSLQVFRTKPSSRVLRCTQCMSSTPHLPVCDTSSHLSKGTFPSLCCHCPHWVKKVPFFLATSLSCPFIELGADSELPSYFCGQHWRGSLSLKSWKPSSLLRKITSRILHFLFFHLALKCCPNKSYFKIPSYFGNIEYQGVLECLWL